MKQPSVTRILQIVHPYSALTASQIAPVAGYHVDTCRRSLRRLWKSDQVEIVARTREGRHWRSRQLDLPLEGERAHV